MKASLHSITLALLCSAGGWLSSACGGVQLEHVRSSVQQPSNVAIYVAVDDGGEPVTDLLASDFSVEEDGVLLAPSETRLSLLDREAVALHHTLVLVDLSGRSGTDGSDPARRAIQEGVRNLVEKLRATQGVTVLGFDGSPRLHPLGEFARSADGSGAARPDLGSIERFRARDESRNLNGAVIAGLRQLDSRLMRLKRPVRVGTLVVFTQGDDLAGRVTEQALLDALDQSSHQVYALGIEGRETRQLEAIGRQGVRRSQDASSVPIAFEELAAGLKKAWSKYYLLQYCSPARTGIRHVRFTVRHEDAEGQTSTDSLDFEFDATGFRGGCDPEARPFFVTALSEPGEIEARRAEAEAAKPRTTGAQSGKGRADGKDDGEQDAAQEGAPKEGESNGPASSPDPAPAEGAPAQNTPAQRTPSQDTPSQDTPTQRDPAQDTPTNGDDGVDADGIVPPPASGDYAD